MRNTLLTIGIILMVLWLLGFAFNSFGGLIHVLLVIAIVVIVWNFLVGGKL